MKWLWLSFAALLCGAALAASVPLRAKECSNGPTIWCQNITTAKACGAVKHCIQTVWEKQTVPDDNDDVCKICKDMVAQARAQLESNETQEELKEVFEGSCKLILVKPIVTECIKMVDEFIPELVETLASQMNPGVVCSVAGLCNSVRIDNMLANAKEGAVQVIPATNLTQATAIKALTQDCADCKVVATEMRKRFDALSRDDFLNNLIEVCGRFGSFSDGCAAAVITHFNALYTHLQQYMVPDQVCHLSGTCDAMFHVHEDKEPKVEVVHESTIGEVKPNNDLPCDLCEKLVAHLQEVLIANTTEAEFLEVLQGLCKQTRGFKDECLSIVDQYYGMIYNYLVKALVPSETCALAGLCPQPGKKLGAAPMWPLLPVQTVNRFKAAELVPAEKVTPTETLHRVDIGQSGASVKVIRPPQLPIERLMPQSMLVSNKKVCTFCEYFLHYLQQAITDPASEENIKDAVEHACDHLPTSLEGTCREFVESYGNAFVALLAQEIDPSTICPKLGLCPSLTIVDINQPPVHDKATCPLCLFAVQELVTKLKDNKTEESIKSALETLCVHLPKSLVGDCQDFVASYEQELIDMLIADFTPQEVCVYLRLCDDSLSMTTTTTLAPEILSNEIPQFPVAKPKVNIDSTECVICEFVLSKLDSMLKNKSTEAEIKQLVHSVCNMLPQTVTKQCNDFVDQYADVIITLLAQELDPKQVCTEIKLCTPSKFYKKQMFTKTIEECMVCEATLGALEGLLDDPTVEQEVGEKLSQACGMLPAAKQQQCRQMVKVYGPSIVNLVMQLVGGRMVCQEIGLCERYVQKVDLLGGKKCTWGPGYWCQSAHHAESCGATKHCIEKVWKSRKPK